MWVNSSSKQRVIVSKSTKMPTVSASLQTLLSRIQPLPSEVAAGESHLASIKARLASAYDLKKFFTAGSFSRDTSIRGKSDVDVFAVVAVSDVKWGDNFKSSNTVLDGFKSELENRFWGSTVYRDGPAVVVEFSDAKVDVVPAFYNGTTTNNWPCYGIPDGVGGWMNTSPTLHNYWLKERNDECGGKLRGTAQLLKFWRECRNPRIPLSSFHIEILLAQEGICKGVKSYAQCVTEVLQGLAARECRAISDPLGVSGRIPAVKSEAQRETSLASVRYSRDHAKAALAADANYDTSEALRQWDIVFNNQLPWV